MKKILILSVLLVALLINNLDCQAQKIYDFASLNEPPTFPGDETGLNNFLRKNIKYPEVAKKNKTQGAVFVTFVVEPNGNLNDINVLRSLTKETDQEVLRVLKNSPKWKPGLVKGEPVRVKYNLPVKFKLP